MKTNKLYKTRVCRVLAMSVCVTVSSLSQVDAWLLAMCKDDYAVSEASPADQQVMAEMCHEITMLTRPHGGS